MEREKNILMENCIMMEKLKKELKMDKEKCMTKMEI